MAFRSCYFVWMQKSDYAPIFEPFNLVLSLLFFILKVKILYLVTLSIGLSTPSVFLFQQHSNFRPRWFEFPAMALCSSSLYFFFFPPISLCSLVLPSSIPLLFAVSALLFTYFLPSIFCIPLGLNIYALDWWWLCVFRLWNGLWFMTFHYWWWMTLIVDDFLFLHIYICYINSW